MAFEVSTSIDIAAPPERVWRALTDLDAYPRWNPTVVRLVVPDGGLLRQGARLRVYLRLEGLPLAVLARVDRLERERVLSWAGGLSPILTGRHWFELEPIEGGCRVHHRERFEGIGAPAVRLLLGRRIEAGYRLLNEALRLEAEAGAGL